MRISDWSSDVCSSDLVPISRDGYVRRVRGVLSALARGEEGGAAVNNRIAEILGEPDPKTLAEAMRAISREKARRASVSQNAGKAAQKASRFVGALPGTNQTGRASGRERGVQYV